VKKQLKKKIKISAEDRDTQYGNERDKGEIKDVGNLVENVIAIVTL